MTSGGFYQASRDRDSRRAKALIARGFERYLNRLEPLEAEVEARLRHARTVLQAVRQEFRTQRTERIGSHSRGTAIRGSSDVDYLVRIPTQQATWGGSRVLSTTILNRTRSALEERFPNTWIHTDWPAVVAEFRVGLDAVDVVPAIYWGTTGQDGYPVFLIPGPDGTWMQASPHRHSRFIQLEIARSRRKLQGTIKLLKAWKFSRTPEVPIIGFHIEVLLAASGICVGAKSYAECVWEALLLLSRRKGAAFTDPLALFGPIAATRTEAQRQATVRALDYAAEHAFKALLAERAGDAREAHRQWRIVFNGQYPAL